MATFFSVIDPTLPSHQSFIRIDSNGGQIGRIKWSNQKMYSFGSFGFVKHWLTIQSITESQLRSFYPGRSQSLDGLKDLIGSLTNAVHDYGSCVYAMSIAAEAAFNYVANQLGVAGFQASCADLDIIRRTRRIKTSFTIVTPDDYLYPQYAYKHGELKKKMEKEAASIALERMRTWKDGEFASAKVALHWWELVVKHYREDEEAVQLARDFYQKHLVD
jgi:hypothetical protein